LFGKLIIDGHWFDFMHNNLLGMRVRARGAGWVWVRTLLPVSVRAPFSLWVKGANNRIIEKIFA
jgi:hypothetical protein